MDDLIEVLEPKNDNHALDARKVALMEAMAICERIAERFGNSDGYVATLCWNEINNLLQREITTND